MSPVQSPGKPRPSTAFYFKSIDTKTDHPTFRPSSRPRTGLLVGRGDAKDPMVATRGVVVHRNDISNYVQAPHCEQRELKEETAEGYDSAIQSGFILQGRLEDYCLQKRLQDCLYGSVFDGVGSKSGDRVAVKILSKGKIKEKQRDTELPETPLAEVFFSFLLKGHKNVFSVREAIEHLNFHFVVSDLALGEDLLELLKAHPNGVPEAQAKVFIRQAAEALSFCHSKRVAMQDFSLENCLLFIGKSEALEVRVCDPGQAVVFGVDQSGAEVAVAYKGCVGKRFRPPEIFQQKPYLASKVDSWCLGWSTFYFLFATEIFESVYHGDGDARWKLLEANRGTELLAQLGVLSRMSQHARSFLLQLLLPNPAQRMSVSDALKHPFLSDASETILIDDLESTALRKRLRKRLESSLASTSRGLEVPKKRPIIPSTYFKHHLKRFCSLSKPSSTLIPLLPEHTRSKSRPAESRKKSAVSLQEVSRSVDLNPHIQKEQSLQSGEDNAIEYSPANRPKSLPKLPMSRLRSNVESTGFVRQLAAGERSIPPPPSSKSTCVPSPLIRPFSTPSSAPRMPPARRRMTRCRFPESPRSSRPLNTTTTTTPAPPTASTPFANTPLHSGHHLLSSRRLLPDVTTCPNIVQDLTSYRDIPRQPPRPILSRVDRLVPSIVRPSVATLPSVRIQPNFHYTNQRPSWADFTVGHQNVTSWSTVRDPYASRESAANREGVPFVAHRTPILSVNRNPPETVQYANQKTANLWPHLSSRNDSQSRPCAPPPDYSLHHSKLLGPRRRAIVDDACCPDEARLAWIPSTRWHVAA